MYKNLILTFLLSFFLQFVNAQVFTGRVIDSTSLEPIEYVTILNKETGANTITDKAGKFTIAASPGANQLQFNLLGYKNQITEVHFPIDTFVLIKLAQSKIEITEVVMKGKKVNLGKEIIRKVIKAKKNRPTHETFERKKYLKLSMNQIHEDINELDSSSLSYFKEEFSSEFKNQNRFKRIIHYQEVANNDNSLLTTSRMGGLDPRTYKGANVNITTNRFDFFQFGKSDYIDIYSASHEDKSISDRPIISPISSTANLFYNYTLKSVEIDGQDSLVTIQVSPKYKKEVLWTGIITVHTSDFHIRDVNLIIDDGLQSNISDLKLVYRYELSGHKWFVPQYEITYLINQFMHDLKVEYFIKYKDWNWKPTFKRGFFNNEIVQYDESALNKDTLFFATERPIPLDVSQKIFLSEQDSIYYEHNSAEYLKRQDSIYNHLTWRNYLLTGIRHKKRSKGIKFGLGPLISWARPFGIGGLRIMPNGDFEKEFLNATKLETDIKVDYGIRNNDWKGSIKIGYVFLPKKFAKVYGFVGDTYDFITVYQSLEAVFSRSNYVRNKKYGGGYAMELFNGVFMNTELEFSDKQSIANLERSPLLDRIFGNLNVPFDFQRYISFIWDTNITIRFNQKYVTRGPRKIILPNESPTLSIQYKKGFPNIFNSEVNFDYYEIRLSQQLPSSQIGSLNYQAKVGGYLNKKSLRFAEYKFFRGSTPYIFTSPIEDYQLLGPTLSTPNTFISGSIIHHFDGFILDKIPGINALQLELLVGGGTLAIPSDKFLHLEAFVGIGKKFKLWKETVQIAAYYITSDSSQTKLDGQFKIGFNFYNAFDRKWLY